MGETGWQVQYLATALLAYAYIDSSACAQDNGAVPQPQRMTFRSHCCVSVFYSFSLKYAFSLLSYSNYIYPSFGGVSYIYHVS
jgi:hypothetical protein